MATKTDSTTLKIASREVGHSRGSRRLRRSGQIPGVLYGLDRENLSFAVDAHELRGALAASGAVLSLDLDGKTTNAVLKEAQVHPVRGEITHIDLVRVDMNKPIQAQVAIELTGAEDSPGVKEGGVLEQPTREVTVEALPSEIPEAITYDASAAEMGDTIFIDALVAPQGVTLILDEETAGETPLLTITAPRSQAELDELETETEVVGEEPGAEGEADGDGDGDESEAPAEGDAE